MLEIKVNVLGELKKIRKGVVYQSTTAVVDELVQNCQRAGATEVHMETYLDKIVIEDNGKGCKNLATVFEKSSSGWGIDEAFGEGFFSTFAIADKIGIYSFDKKIEIDVVHALENEDLGFEIEDSGKMVKGFKVELEGEKLRDEMYRLEEHMVKIGEVLPIETYLNGEKLEKKELTAFKLGEQVDYSMEVDNEFYQGNLAVNNSWEDLELFYEYRKVTNKWFTGLKGKLQLKPNAVTLKAPDRKDIVRDDKYKEFDKQLAKDREELYRNFIEYADNDLIDKYAEKINDILEVNDYLDKLCISEDLTDLSKYIDSEEVDKEGMTEEQLEIMSEFLRKVKESELNGNQESNREEESTVSETEVGIDRVNENQDLVSVTELEKDTSRLVWVSASEVEGLKTTIAEIEYHGFTVLVAKNVLYENAFNHLGIRYIEDFKETVTKENVIDRVELLTKKEKRVMWLLEKIEDYFGIPDTFRIADLKHSVIIKDFDGKVVSKEEKNVEGLCRGAKIYLDRKTLDLPSYRVDKWDSDNLTLHDLRFLLKNQDTIAHELAHLLYQSNDGTVHHMRSQATISREIGKIFS